jgi:hypothetical protein
MRTAFDSGYYKMGFLSLGGRLTARAS